MEDTIDIAMSSMMDRLRERATELDLKADSDEALLEAVLEHDVQIPEPDAEECLRYYESHGEQLRQDDLLEADHILFAVTESTPIDLLRKHAEHTLNTLLSGQADFGEVALGESNCPSAQVGGNLGQLSRDQCVPEFWNTLIEFGQPGLVPRLVRTRFGLHIVRIQRIEQGNLPPFEAVRALVTQRLRERSLVRAMQLYVEDLRRQADGESGPDTANCPV